MQSIIFTQNRTGSTRLHKKWAYSIGDKTVLEWGLYHAEQAGMVVTLVPRGDELVGVLRDVEDWDLMSRFMAAMHHYKPEILVRITSDCPFVSPAVISHLIRKVEQEYDYASNVPRQLDGSDVQVWSSAAFEYLNGYSDENQLREHPGLAMDDIYTSRWKCHFYSDPYINDKFPKMSIDTIEDFENIKARFK